MRLGKAPFFLPLCLLFLVLVTPCWSAQDTGSEIRRLLNEAPPLASFPGAPGMIWKQHLEYRMLADGSLEKTTRWFILSGKDLPEAWRAWTPTVRSDGSIEVLESGIFDPLTGRIVMPLLPKVIEGEGFRTVEIRSPELEEEQLLCVAFREFIPSRYNVDDFLWAAFGIPVWEQTVVVEVPAESTFNWKGHDVPEPSMEEGQGVRRYTWTMVNRAPLGKPTVAVPQRPYLAFSLLKGIRPALDDLGAIAQQGVNVQAPQALSCYLRGDKALKRIRRFLDALDASSHHLEGVPGRLVRSSGSLAGSESWTDWERTLLAGHWLRSSGVGVDVCWLPKVSQEKDGPATAMAWARPVLEIQPKGGDVFLWSAGQRDAVGESFSLFGQTLYRVENGGFRARKVPSGEVEDHRLILTWNLALDDTGAMEGTLRVDVRGGWMELLGDSSLGMAALDSLISMPHLPHLAMEKPEVGTGDDSVRFEIPVSFNAGIPSGAGALLLRFPSAGFPALDVSRVPMGDSLSLRFPFVVDQRYNIHLPEGYRVVATPSLAGTENGAVRFSEELRERAKKGRLEGSFRMVVTERELDSDQARKFEGVSRRVAQWGALTIPLKK